MTNEEKRQKILDTVSDLVVNFCYYDRKEDEELSEEDLGAWIRTEEVVSIHEIATYFEAELEKEL